MAKKMIRPLRSEADYDAALEEMSDTLKTSRSRDRRKHRNRQRDRSDQVAGRMMFSLCRRLSCFAASGSSEFVQETVEANKQ
jgi:hypothetical protein